MPDAKGPGRVGLGGAGAPPAPEQMPQTWKGTYDGDRELRHLPAPHGRAAGGLERRHPEVAGDRRRSWRTRAGSSRRRCARGDAVPTPGAGARRATPTHPHPHPHPHATPTWSPPCGGPASRTSTAPTRRRAEYSTDASQLPGRRPRWSSSRGTPTRWRRRWRSAGRTGVPLTARGAGTSIAGNAVGPGVVAGLLAGTSNRVLDVDAGGADRHASSRASCWPTLQRGRAPHGLRFGPDPSTHTRCTIGGMIGNNACGSRALALRPHRRQRRGARRASTGPGERLTAAPAERRRRCPACATSSRPTSAAIRTELGRFGRQVSGYSLEHLLPEHGARPGPGAGRHRGHLRRRARGDRAAGAGCPRRTALVVLGYPDMADGRRRRPGAAAAPARSPSRASTPGMVDVVRRRRGAGRGARPAARAAAGCSSSSAATDAGRGRRPRPRLVADARRRSTPRSSPTPAEAAALWRIREDGAGLAGRTPAGAPALAGLGGRRGAAASGSAPTCASSTRCCAEHGLDGLPYGHFGDGCVHVRIDFPLDRAGRRARVPARSSPTPPAGRRHGGSLSGEHGDGRARSELLPLMYSPAALGAVRGGQGAVRPGRPAQPRRPRRPAPARRRPAPPGAPAAGPAAARCAYPHDGGDFTTAVHRCTGVGKCRADLTGAGGVMCPSYLATRDEKDSTRGRARVLQEMANGRLRDRRLAVAGGARGAGPVPVLQGLRRRLPGRRRHGHLQGRGAAPALPRAGCARARTTAGLAAALGAAGRAARRGLVERARCAPGRLAAAGEAAGRHGPARRPLPPFARPHVPRAGSPAARRRPGPGDPVLLWVDSFTDRSRPEVGMAAVEVLEAAGLRGARARPAGLLRADLDHHRPARRRAPAACAAAVGPRPAPAPGAGIPIVGLEPSCTAVLRSTRSSCCPATARAGGWRPDADPGRAAHRARGWEPPSLRGVDGRRAAALPPPRRAGLGRRPRAAAARRRDGDRGSAAAAGWPATSASSAATTTCRWRSPSSAAAGGPRRRAGRPSCWPTASPAGPSSTTWPAGAGLHLAELLADALDR